MENIILSCYWNDSINVSLKWLKTMQQYWQPGKRDHVISGTGWILPRFFFKLFLGFKWQGCVNFNTRYCLDISKLSDRLVNFSEVFVEWLSVTRQFFSNCVSFLTKIILEPHTSCVKITLNSLNLNVVQSKYPVAESVVFLRFSVTHIELHTLTRKYIL